MLSVAEWRGWVRDGVWRWCPALTMLTMHQAPCFAASDRGHTVMEHALTPSQASSTCTCARSTAGAVAPCLPARPPQYWHQTSSHPKISAHPAVIIGIAAAAGQHATGSAPARNAPPPQTAARVSPRTTLAPATRWRTNRSRGGHGPDSRRVECKGVLHRRWRAGRLLSLGPPARGSRARGRPHRVATLRRVWSPAGSQEPRRQVDDMGCVGERPAAAAGIRRDRRPHDGAGTVQRAVSVGSEA